MATPAAPKWSPLSSRLFLEFRLMRNPSCTGWLFLDFQMTQILRAAPSLNPGRDRKEREGRKKLILMCGLLIQIPEKYQGVKGKMSSLQRAYRGGAWEGNAAPSICSEHGAGAGSCCRSWWIRALPGARSCSRKFLWELPSQGMFPAMSTSAGNAEGAPSGPS